MKENYFTPGNIDSVSRKMMARVTKRAGCSPAEFRCAKPALLIIDMQKYFLERKSHAFIPSAPPIVRNIRKLVGIFARAGLPIIFTRHLNSRKNAGMLGKWWGDVITQKNPYHKIIDGLEYAGAKIIQKSQYDAFYKTGLGTHLRKNKVDALVITGVMAHLCCETTARSAFVRGFDVYFVVDGTATQNIDFHYAALLNLAHGFAVPVLTNELIKNLEARNA